VSPTTPKSLPTTLPAASAQLTQAGCQNRSPCPPKRITRSMAIPALASLLPQESPTGPRHRAGFFGIVCGIAATHTAGGCPFVPLAFKSDSRTLLASSTISPPNVGMFLRHCHVLVWVFSLFSTVVFQGTNEPGIRRSASLMAVVTIDGKVSFLLLRTPFFPSSWQV